MDVAEVIEHKIKVIRSCPELIGHCGTIRGEGKTQSEFHSESYHALSQDATKPLQLINKLVHHCNITKTDPILFIFECVLLYWNEEASTNFIFTLNKTFDDCNFVVFDLVNTGDKFSDVMQESLTEKQTPLLGARSITTLQDWKRKFEVNGSKYVQAWLMTQIYPSMFDQADVRRVERIEFLDEVELLDQLFHHYALVIAGKSKLFSW